MDAHVKSIPAHKAASLFTRPRNYWIIPLHESIESDGEENGNGNGANGCEYAACCCDQLAERHILKIGMIQLWATGWWWLLAPMVLASLKPQRKY